MRKTLIIGFGIIGVMESLLLFNNYLLAEHLHPLFQACFFWVISVLIGMVGVSTSLYWFNNN